MKFKFTPPNYDEVAQEGFAKLDELASGASTGEPPRPICKACCTEVCIHSRCPNCHRCDQCDERAARPSEPSAPHLTKIREGVYEGKDVMHKVDAARLSEIAENFGKRAAAPQTSAEQWKKQCLGVGTCRCVGRCQFAPAPQPVSGDAPGTQEVLEQCAQIALTAPLDHAAQDKIRAAKSRPDFARALRESIAAEIRSLPASPSVAGTQPTPEERELLLAQFFPQGTPQVEEDASLTAELIKLLDGPPSLCNYCGHSFPKGPIIYGGQNHCPLSPNGFHGFTVTIGGPDNRPHIISEFLRSHGVGAPAQPGPQHHSNCVTQAGYIAKYSRPDLRGKPCDCGAAAQGTPEPPKVDMPQLIAQEILDYAFRPVNGVWKLNFTTMKAIIRKYFLRPYFPPASQKEKTMHVELSDTDLYLNGLATDHIWIMETGPESHPIGIRLDCGDSGTVYLSRTQAKDLAEQLHRFAAPGSVPQAPDKRDLRSALEALAKDYKEEVRNAETSFAYMNAMEVLGVPQAEPPKEEKQK